MLHHEITGKGSPVVLLHEGIVDSRSWSKVVPLLAPHHTVVTYALRRALELLGKVRPSEWPDIAAATGTSALTRSGCSSVKSIAIRPPRDVPTSAVRSSPAAPSTQARSSTREYGPSGRGERP